MARTRTKEGGGVTRIDPGKTTKVQTVVKTRKHKGPTNEDRWMVLDEYMSGKLAHQIAKEKDWDTKLTKVFIQKLIQRIRNVHETNVLIDASEIDMAGHDNTHLGKRVTFATVRDIDKKINEEFAPLISDPMEPILTDGEMTFAHMLVSSGDWKEAMMAAGFDAGLIKGSDTGYNQALRLRCFYLKKKPNVEAFIREIQAQNAREYKVDKSKIQASLLQRIQVIENQADPKMEATLAKYYQLLGQTTGAFIEKVEIREVSIDDVVKKMLEMRKVRAKEQEKCLPGDNDDEGVWEYGAEGEEVPDQVEDGEDPDA